MTALSPAGVWAELPFQFQKRRPRGGLWSARQACAPSSSALPVGPCFSQHTTAQKGSNLRQRELVIARFTWVRWKRNSCQQAEGRGRVGRRRWSSPRRGCQLSAPTLHLSISLQFKESFLHLSASGVWDRFPAQEGWAAPRILAWLGTRSGKGWVGQGQFPCPRFAVGPRAQD